ncbi:CheW protein [Chondrocystis sp. NIES-4102]|nr:CheW protein [Chondrocystis sp. NIES-4102]
MSNLTIKSNTNKLLASKNNTIKLLIFEVGKLTLSLPILQVQKVIKQQPLHGSGLSYVNLTHIEEQEVVIVDLHQKLFKINQEDTSGYFIISKNITGEPLGIKVELAPTLIDVASNNIRLIPNSYRRSDTLAIASHVTVISKPNQASLTIFILDLERLI